MSDERKLVSVDEIAKLLANENGDWPFSVEGDQVELVIESNVYTLSKEEFSQLQDAAKTVSWREYSNGEQVESETPEALVDRLLDS